MFAVTTVLTLSLAKALGLYMIAAGLSGLTAPGRWQDIIDGLRSSPALTYAVGVLVLALGAAIVLAHDVWSDPLAVVVSLIGWAALIEGFVLIAFPEPLLAWGASLVRPGATRPWAIGAIVFGTILLLAGFVGRAGASAP
jgi:hypothetical protein